MRRYIGSHIYNSLYARNLFDQIVDAISIPTDAVLVHISCTGALGTLKFEQSHVVIAMEDTPDSGAYNSISDIKSLAHAHSDKNFLLILAGGPWSTHDYAPASNIQVVNWNYCQDILEYPKLAPLEKNFNSARIGISLNRQMREHRLALISLLYGLDLDKYSNITAQHLYKQFAKCDSADFLDHNPWMFAPKHDELKTKLDRGFRRVHELYHSKQAFQYTDDAFELVPGSETVVTFDNIKNFNSTLRQLYADSFVEFVTCTLYSQPRFHLSEKILNNIYGQNFPIIISTVGMVDYYRRSGMDMFDDVVDHSYDTIADPVDRLEAAVVRNQPLLTDPDRTKQLWQQRQQRFDANVKLAQNNFNNYFTNLTLAECNQVCAGILQEPFKL